MDPRVEYVIKRAEKSGGGAALSLRLLAKEIGISPAHLATLFKRATGKLFKTYLREFRVNRAAELLQRPDLSIKAGGGDVRL